MSTPPEIIDIGPPQPNSGWSHDIQTLQSAIVVPAKENGFVQVAGVLHSDGRYCPEGALWRNNRALTIAPSLPSGPIEELSGTWLWGGQLWNHFGHFIAESTSRLWPLPELASQIDGVLFIPKRPRKRDFVEQFQRDFVNLMEPDLPVKSVCEPVRVENLIVPGQGFGLGKIARMTEPYRKAIADNFASQLPSDGPEKLYVSRSKLRKFKGGLVGEERIESYLAEQGYEIFHPQRHDVQTQIARYKAAKTILAAEGSAIHLVAMSGNIQQKIGIILRRRSGATAQIAHHVLGLTGVQPIIFDALLRNWGPVGQRRKHTWMGEYDLTLLQKQLLEHGFLAQGEPVWTSLEPDEVQQNLGQGYEVAETY